MAKRIDRSDVVLMVEVGPVAFRDFIGEMVRMQLKRLMAFVIGLNGGDLHIPGEDFIFPCIRN